MDKEQKQLLPSNFDASKQYFVKMWEVGRSAGQVFVRDASVKFQSFDEDTFEAFFVPVVVNKVEQPSTYAKMGLKWEILHDPTIKTSNI